MKLETKTLAHINTAQERISEMIAVLLGTREELIKLLKENLELRDQLRGKGTMLNERQSPSRDSSI
jgi:hypothetical protein